LLYGLHDLLGLAEERRVALLLRGDDRSELTIAVALDRFPGNAGMCDVASMKRSVECIGRSELLALRVDCAKPPRRAAADTCQQLAVNGCGEKEWTNSI